MAHFDAHRLTFMYEEAVADRAYALFEARGRQHGRDLEDWLEAERQLGKPAVASARYRVIQESPLVRAPLHVAPLNGSAVQAHARVSRGPRLLCSSF